jgi:MFS transporter, ACS family, hexuronate transporter
MHLHPSRRWALAATATLGMSVSYIDRQTLAAIAPAVKKALDIDHTHYGWLLSAFSVAYLVGAPAAGIVVDRLGARRAFAFAVVVWSIVAAAHWAVTSFAMLFALRILLGTAESPSFPSAAQAIRRALPGAQRPLAFGLLFTGSSIGAVVAGKLAVSLDASVGWRNAFLGTALIGILWLPAWLLATRGFGLDRPAERPKEIVVQASWRETVTSPAVVRSLVAIVGSAPAIMFVLNWTSQYLVEEWHFKKEDVGNHLVVAPLVFDVAAIAFGWLASRREGSSAQPRTHTDLFVVAGLLSACLALAPLVHSPNAAIALFALSAAGGGGIYVLVTADMLSRVPIDKTSSAGGMTAAAQSLAHIIAAPLLGRSIDRTHGYSQVMVTLGLFVLPTTLAFALWPGMTARSHANPPHDDPGR